MIYLHIYCRKEKANGTKRKQLVNLGQGWERSPHTVLAHFSVHLKLQKNKHSTSQSYRTFCPGRRQSTESPSRDESQRSRRLEWGIFGYPLLPSNVEQQAQRERVGDQLLEWAGCGFRVGKESVVGEEFSVPSPSTV